MSLPVSITVVLMLVCIMPLGWSWYRADSGHRGLPPIVWSILVYGFFILLFILLGLTWSEYPGHK